MNYLEWKKRILIYQVARGKPINAIPEELDFYIYTRFKSVDVKSLPTHTAIAFRVGTSMRKAIAALAMVLGQFDSTIPIATYLRAAAAEAAPTEMASELATDFTFTAPAVDCKSDATGKLHSWIYVDDIESTAINTTANPAKATIIDTGIGLMGIAYCTNSQAAQMAIPLLLETSTLITLPPVQNTRVDMDLDTELTVDAKLSSTLIKELVGDIGAELDIDAGAFIDELEPTTPNNVQIEAPAGEINATAGLIEIRPVKSDTTSLIGTAAKVACLQRAFIADYAGVTISSLQGVPIKTLTHKEL